MIERTTSVDQVWTWGAVVATIGLYCISAGLMILGHWLPAIFVAEVACGVSAYAAVRAIKCYAVRLCELIRRCDGRLSDREPTPPVPFQRVH